MVPIMGPFFVPIVGSQGNRTPKTRTMSPVFIVHVVGNLPRSFLTVRPGRGLLMQSDLFSFNPDQETPYWIPYDTIVRNVPEHGGVKLSDLVKAVDNELRPREPVKEQRKGKRPIKKASLPQEEFSRLLTCEVLTIEGGVVFRGVGVVPHA